VTASKEIACSVCYIFETSTSVLVRSLYSDNGFLVRLQESTPLQVDCTVDMFSLCLNPLTGVVIYVELWKYEAAAALAVARPRAAVLEGRRRLLNLVMRWGESVPCPQGCPL